MTSVKKLGAKFGVLTAAFLLSVGSADARVSADKADDLRNGTLTPFGAEKAGNKSGTIPAWTGGITKAAIPASYRVGMHHPDPFGNEQAQYTITAKNMAQYEQYLTDGEKALFRTYPDTFQMPIYTSRRSHSAPQWVYDNTYKNASSAMLKDCGVTGAIGGIPFPVPSGSNAEQAEQVIWNHILRWRGEYVVRRASEVAVQRNGDYQLVTSQQEVWFKYYDRGIKRPEDLGNVGFYFISTTLQPARLAGGAVLIWETIDQCKNPRQAWGYNAGQRRVKQAPNLAYDTPIAAADGLRTADDTDIYNGATDKYDWKLVGKKEMFIPYNNYDLSSPKIKYKDLLWKGHMNPKYTRYELHRVWVVEATLKKGERHVYSKRRFYLDEDSWSAATVDQYNGQGELWRVSMAFLKNYYEVPTTWTARDVFYDLDARRYHEQLMDNEETTTLDFSQQPPGESYFTKQALQRRGTR